MKIEVKIELPSLKNWLARLTKNVGNCNWGYSKTHTKLQEKVKTFFNQKEIVSETKKDLEKKFYLKWPTPKKKISSLMMVFEEGMEDNDRRLFYHLVNGILKLFQDVNLIEDKVNCERYYKSNRKNFLKINR